MKGYYCDCIIKLLTAPQGIVSFRSNASLLIELRFLPPFMAGGSYKFILSFHKNLSDKLVSCTMIFENEPRSPE